jgi:uncharacterized protein (TIGR02466 family)
MAAEAQQSQQKVSAKEALSRGFALHQAGKRKEAEAIYRRVLEALPNHPDALHLLGVARRQSGKPKEAIELIRKAIAANPDNPVYMSNLGTAFEAAGETDKAAAAYRRAIKMKADFADPCYKLGMLLQKLGRPKDAVAAIKRATELKPDAGDWFFELGKLLGGLKRYDLSVEPLQRAVALMPENSEAHHKLGTAFYALGRPDEALAANRRAVELKPDLDAALFAISAVFMDRKEPLALLEECDLQLARDPGNRRVISSKICALQDLGRHEEARALLDFGRLVKPVEIGVPEGFASLADFNAALTDEVRKHPTLVFEKSGHATKFGGHTGNILPNPGPAVAALEKIMRRESENYMRDVKVPAGHPFLDGKPDKWKLQAWAVVMDVKGHQVPHIHPAAWLSGVYYAKIPPAAPNQTDAHAGWIEFGRPQENMAVQSKPDVKLFKPKEGLMFLFPAYFYHMTIPIETEEQRISIAFDVVSEANAGKDPY